MSQSATLYRVSKDIFEQLGSGGEFDTSSAKNYTIFESSFMGLEYILSKKQDISTTKLINEIFNPKQFLGWQEFENLTEEEKFEFYESGKLISYLDPIIISKINSFLESISEAEIRAKYDSKELNDNDIYPNCWHDDNSPDLACNLRHILADFLELKIIIKQAATENDYIFVFVG